jgi:hypothetical protein
MGVIDPLLPVVSVGFAENVTPRRRVLYEANLRILLRQ